MSTERTLSLVFLAITVIAFVVMLVMIGRTRKFMATALAVNGTIVGHEARRSTSSSGSGMSTSYHPVVTFATTEGQALQFVDSVGGLSRKVGKVVPVRYDPVDPSNARIASGWRIWFGPSLLGVVGAAFLVPAVILFVTG